MLALEKKFEQTIKFQVLVAQYGIALSLSSLQWQMLGECAATKRLNLTFSQHLTDI